MRVLLWLALGLVLGVCVCSAALRLANSTIGCTPEPACRLAQPAPATAGDAVLPAAADDAVPAWQQTLRLTHRISATLAGLVFVFIVLFGFAQWSAGERVAGISLLLLAALLALVGRVTPSPSPAVVLANLLGGHLLLAALAWLLARPAPRQPDMRGHAALGWPLAVAVLLLSASGGWAGAPGAAMPAWLPALHLALGLAVTVTLVAAAWRLRRLPLVAPLAGASALAAVATGLSGLPPLQQAFGWPAAATHSVLAGLTLAGCTALWRLSRRAGAG